MAKSSPAKDYYKGAYKVSIGGVPCRITQKPTPHMLALMRDNEGFSTMKANAAIRYPETTYQPPLI